MNRTIYSQLLCLIFFCFLSCSKDDHNLPDPVDQSGKKELQTKIAGKWIIETRSGRTTAGNAFLEFLPDSTYILYNVTDTLVTGKFQTTSGTEILLTGFGTLTEIKFSNKMISVKVTYSGKTITITAGQSDIIDADGKTELLTRNWSLTTEEDGPQLINEALGIDRVTVLFTASHTYLVQFFFKGKLVESGMNNWKWHSLDPNRFIYWEEGKDIKEGNYGTIHELSKSGLKVTDNADGNPLTFKMTPVN